MDPKIPITPHFTWHEALWLPAWEVMHLPTAEEIKSIGLMSHKMELVREWLEVPLNIHCWIRPTCVNAPGSKWDKRNYNAFVGGAPGSAHIEGNAVDFNPIGMDCGSARMILMNKLEEFQIRMENTEGNWVHCDRREPMPKRPRFFRP